MLGQGTDPAGRKAVPLKSRRGTASFGTELQEKRNDIGVAVSFHGPAQRGKRVGSYRIVSVQKEQVLAPSCLQPRIPGAAQAQVLLVNHPDPAGAAGGQGIAEGTTAVVRGAVVYQNDLVVGAIPGQDGIHTGGQIIRYVVNRNDYTKPHGALLHELVFCAKQKPQQTVMAPLQQSERQFAACR